MWNEIPDGEDCIVMKVLGDDKYSVWWFNHGDPEILTVTSATELKAGECVTKMKDGFVFNARRSKGLAMIHNRATPLVKMRTTVVVPLPSYFDRFGATIPMGSRKHVVVGRDVGVVACVTQLMEQMEPGVAYELYITNYGITPPEEADTGILKVLHNMNTYWLASKQTAKEAPYTRVFAAQMISKHGVYMKGGQEQQPEHETKEEFSKPPESNRPPQQQVEVEAACRLESMEEEYYRQVTIDTTQEDAMSEQLEPQAICDEEIVPPKEDFESVEGKKMTHLIIQKVLNNPRICDAFREANAAPALATLQYAVSRANL